VCARCQTEGQADVRLVRAEAGVKPPLVEVTCEDAVMQSQWWMSPEAYMKLMDDDSRRMQTAGYLVVRNRKYVAVALASFSPSIAFPVC